MCCTPVHIKENELNILQEFSIIKTLAAKQIISGAEEEPERWGYVDPEVFLFLYADGVELEV